MKNRLIALFLVIAMALTMLPAVYAADGLTGSIDAGQYDAAKSTVTYTASTNAADLESAVIAAGAGEVLVFDNLDFTGAQVLMMVAAISEGSTGKAIDLYVDEVAEANKIGTLTTRSAAKVSDLDFNEQYAALSAVSGVHDLILQFREATELELDWIKLTSYTGSETEAERDARMQWWRDAKFGQFIHLGAYSYLGGYYNGQKSSGYSEWIMNNMRIPKEEYAENVAANFNPKDFNPEKIVSDAKAAGQKYIIITSRHHEGFSIFDTQIRNFKDYSLFSVGNQGEYAGLDLVKSLAEECQKQGLKFGVYTTIMDWHDPSQTGYGGSIADGYTKEAYKAQLKGQIKELIEDFGVEVFFFDGEWVGWWTKADGQEMYRYILSLKEDCVVNNRVGKRHVDDGDYGTPEQEIPATGLDYDWESCVTMNNNWGYCIGDSNWKSPQWIVNSVVDIASKGGNLLLNVGPDGNGVVEQAPIDNMKAAGQWFEAFGVAVYGTRANCFTTALDSSLRVTTKENKLYVTLLEKDPAALGSITIPALENEILSVKELATGNDVPFEKVGDRIFLTVAGTAKQDYATVYEITVDGVPTEVEKEPVVNLALGAATTCSSYYVVPGQDYTANSLVDGNRTQTRWAPKDYGDDPSPWAILDLGEAKEFGKVCLYEWRQSASSAYRCTGFKISVSDDGETWTLVHEGTGIGEELIVELDQPAKGRYVKIHDITMDNPSGSASAGTPTLYELELYAPSPKEPAVAFTGVAATIWGMPFTLQGTYEAGETVEVRVWGASFQSFTVPAVMNAETGTWTVEIDDKTVTEGQLTFTAYLKDAEGNTVAANVSGTEFYKQQNLAAGKPVTLSTYWVDNPPSDRDFSGKSLVDGNLSTRWAPLDQDENPSAVIDFEETVEIGTVVLYEWLDTYFTKEHRSESFKLSVSDDGETWTEIYTGGQINEKLTVELDEPVEARYLKIHDITLRANAKGNVSLNEVVVFAPEKLPDVTLKVSGEEAVTVDTESLTYTVSVEDAENLATATLELALNDTCLSDPVVEGRNGWYVIVQSYADGKLHVVMGNNEGVTGSGELLAVTVKTTGKTGDASVEITGAVLSAYTDRAETYVNAVLGEAFVTKIDYSIYDVNRDGVVNQLDLTRAQRYYGTADAVCDVDGSGEVDIADLILILNHYTK